MAEEKITQNDFVDPSVLKELQAINKEMKDIVKTITQFMAVSKANNEELKKGSTTQEEVGKRVKTTQENTQKLSDVEKEIQKIEQQHYQVLTKMVAQRSEESRKLQQAIEQSKKENLERKASINNIEGLRAKNQLLRMEKEKLILTDKNYKSNLERINAEMDKNQKIIDSANNSEQKRLKGIGKYKEGIVKAYVAIQGAIILAQGAFNLFIDAMKSTGRGADDFEASLEGLKQGFNQIKIAVSTLDFTDFTKKVRDAIAEGKRYAEGLDEIDDKTRALKISEAEAANEILRQRQIQNSALSTNKQKIAAGQKIIDLEKQLQEIRVGIADQAYKNELDNIASIANGTKDVNDNMRNEIELYVKRDANIIKQVENGNKYAKNLTEINKLQESQKSNAKIGILDDVALNRINELQKENISLYNDYLLMLRVTTPNDEKYNQLVEKRVELESAKGSAMENTLRIQSKLDSALEKSDDKQKEKGEDLNKKGEEWLKDYLNRENKKREESVKSYEDTNQKWIEESLKASDDIKKIHEDTENDRVKNAEKAWESEKRIYEQRKAIEQELNDYKQQIANQSFEFASELYNRQISDLERQKDYELSLAGDNAKAKESIETRYASKIAAIKRKQAIADKAQAIFNIILSTAQAIIGFRAKPGFPSGIPLAVAAGILGAAQAATVAAQPIPKFAKGVTDFEGGRAIVGEEGREAIRLKSGQVFLSPETATQMMLPSGTDVYTHAETEAMLRGGMQADRFDKLISEQRATRKALASKPVKEIKITDSGWKETTRLSNAVITHTDKYFRK